MCLRVFFVILLTCLLAACSDSSRRSAPATSPAAPVGSAAGQTSGQAPASENSEVAADRAASEGGQPDGELVVEGTGRFINAPARLDAREVSPGQYTVTIDDAPLEEIVRFVLGDLLGEGFLIEQPLSGSASIRTSDPLDRERLLDVLEMILTANGFGLVEAAGIYRVGALEKAATRADIGLGVIEGDRPVGVSTEVFALRFVSPEDLLQLIEPLLPDTVGLLSQPERNLLLVSGDRPGRDAAARLIQMFDVDQLAGRSFALFPIASANPATIIEELRQIFGASSSAPDLSMLRLLPIDRLNSILVISTRPHLVQQVREWITRLDRGQATDQTRLYVYYVQHGNADEIAEILASIFSQGTRNQSIQSPSVPAEPTAPGLDATTLGDPAILADGLTGQPRNVARPLQGLGAGPPSTITADNVNNALFILATPRQYELIEGAIRHIDLRPTQVLIEATIAEVVLNDELRYGVQWFFREGDHQLRLSDVSTGVPAAQFPGFSYAFSNGSADVVLNALEGVTDVRVISSPQIMVLDNRSAVIQVGDQVPVASQSAVSAQNPDSPIVNRIEFKDTGIILRVSPSVNASGTVTMEVEQEVSNVVPTTTSGIDSPTIQQRIIKSTVAVQDGQSVALGGLIRESDTRVNSGLPLLSRIPIIGGLFGQKRKEGSRTELLVIITPRIVSNPEEAEDVTEYLRSRLQEAAALLDRVGKDQE